MRTSTHDSGRRPRTCQVIAIVIGLCLAAALTTPTDAAVRDIWVESVSYSQNGANPNMIDVSVEIARQGTAGISGALLVIKKNNIQVNSFMIPDPIVAPFTHTMAVSGGDAIEVVVDATNIYPELNEINNELTWSFPSNWSLQAMQEPFPATITISDPANLTLAATGIVEQRRTGFFPAALLIVPPFNWWQAEHDGAMVTELKQTQVYYQEDEESAGVTAGLAVEAGFSVQGCGASVGAELEVQMSAAFGRTIQQTYSESFSAATTNSYIPGGDHTVVLAQTRYDVMQYRVTTPGNYYGQSMWIGVPQVSDVDPNPELTGEVLSVYAELKDPDAVGLDGAHDIGKIKSYSCGGTGIENETWHLDNVTNASQKTLAEKRQTVGTTTADWSCSIETGSYATTSQSFSCNFYAKSEIAGSSVQVSFGSTQGKSHKVYQGKSHDFHFRIAGVDQSRNRYKLGGWAANYTFTHGVPQRRDGLLVLCFYVHEPPENNTSPVREILIGGDWDDWNDNWEVAIDGYPGSQHLADPILDGLTININSPIAQLGQDFYQAYLDLMDAEIVWAMSVNPPPPEIDDFFEVATLARNRLEEIVWTDPENPDWIPEVLAMIDNVHEEANWVFNPRPCRIEPEHPREGESVELFYHPERGALPAGSTIVFARLGFDGWQGGHVDHPMMPNPETGMWESGPLPVPPGVEVVDYVFASDAGDIDDRRGRGWHAETVGPVRTHRSGSIDVSFSESGVLGFSNGSQATGSGFCYPAGGTNWLYLGGLWVGNDAFVANRDYDAEPDPEWMADGGVRHDECRGSHLTTATYSDAPHGLRVTQRAMTQGSAPDDDFVIVTYDIRNEGEAGLEDLWVGQFADFDLDASSMLENHGGTDEALSLAYMYKDQGTPYVGVCLLDRQATANLTLIHNPTFVHPTEYIADTEKSLFLSAADPAHSVQESTEASDWSLLVSAGPYDLPADAGVSVTFAIIAGDDLDDLRANAERAREWLLPGASSTGIDDAGVQGVTAMPQLHQNAPNPFNPFTSIAFDLPRRGHVTLRVYDVNGRAVRTLIDGVRETGSNAVTWDGRNEAGGPVSSGVYLYRMETEQGTHNRKMTVVR